MYLSLNVEFSLALFLFYLNSSVNFGIVFTLLVSDYILFYNAKKAVISVTIGFIIYNIIDPLNPLKTFGDFTVFVLDAANYSILICAVVLMKSQILQSVRLQKLSDALIEKSKEVEALAVFKERNRIASDMHDTVGHTLSLSLIELEAAKALFKKKPGKSYEKIVSGRLHVYESLEEIRRTVKSLNNSLEDKTLELQVDEICSNAELHGGLSIKTHIRLTTELHKIQNKVIVNAIKESLTNVIKHGKIKEVEIELTEKGTTIEFAVSSYFASEGSIKKGYGLANIEKNIIGIGGVFNIETKNDRLTIYGKIPVGR